MSSRVGVIRRGAPASTAGVPAPADKRFRRSDPRGAGRRRLGQITWKLVRLAAILGVVVAGFVWLGTTVLGSPMFQVQRLVVRGHTRLSVGDVEALVAGIRGERIVRVDFEHYRRRLMDSPWVESASLWRVLPSTIEVRIVERSPLVIARVGQQLYLVDGHGVIIDEYGPQHRDFDLPIVDGLVRPEATSGPLVDPARLALIARLLAAVESHAGLRDRLSQVDVSAARDAVVLLDGDPALLHLGDTRFVERVQAYLELAPTLRERLGAIDSVDLRFDERVYVRSRTARETKVLAR